MKSMKFSMLKGIIYSCSHTSPTDQVSQVIPSITQTHRLRPKPIFFTRFNTLEIFYVRIILMVLRCVRRRCSVMTPNIFPRDFLLDPETGLAASQMSSPTFYVLDSWHQAGQGMRHTFAHSLRGLARIFGAGLGRIRGKCGLLVFIVAIKVI